MCIAPPLLVAAMAVQISRSLGLNSGALGLAVSGFFAATASSTALLGRVVSRWGVRPALTTAMAVNGVVLVSIALSQSIWQIVVALVVGGIANGAVHPASNVVLAGGVRGHLGLALGIKQSSMPAAALVGGIAVPAVALTVGWRWAFVMAAALSAVLVAVASRYRQPGGEDSGPAQAGADGPPSVVLRLRLLSAAVCCGAAAGTSLNVFMVDGSVQSHILAPAKAGLLAACCGMLAVLARVGLGWQADRRPDRDPTAPTLTLLATCVVGSVLMSTGHPAAFVVGAVLAAGLGFGWTGLVHLSAMRGSTDTARTTGTLMTGFASGSCLGPLVLGHVAAQWGYRPVWISVTVLGLLAAAMMSAVTTRRVVTSKGASR
ncbi:MFS transporter [Mycolicibacterium sp.]|uniref:MFS transporter n=3 Tax=Mycolicibacterium sp. TaxID=2320850 RepID=UPI003D0A65C3